MSPVKFLRGSRVPTKRKNGRGWANGTALATVDAPNGVTQTPGRGCQRRMLERVCSDTAITRSAWRTAKGMSVASASRFRGRMVRGATRHTKSCMVTTVGRSRSASGR